MSAAQQAVQAHLEASFGAGRVKVAPCAEEIALTRLPHLRLATVAPTVDRPYGVYATIGCWDVVHDGEHGIEFVILGDPLDERRHLLRLAMVAFYHANDDESFRLDVGHTMPLGEPWLPGSTLDSVLVSLPYPLGPDFEMCDWAGGQARLLWLLPITTAEREYRHAHDLEALEQRFDEASIDFADPSRDSVV
jgi:hypothetical protein